jgi:glycosyltransferase involved in cell wall biosynthesis
MRETMLSFGIAKPIEIIPTGISTEDILVFDKIKLKQDSQLIAKNPLLRNKKILMTAGRIGKEKNILFLLDVLEKLMPDFQDILLLVVGDGPFRSELEDIVKKRGLEKNTVFTGYVDRRTISEYFSLSDLFVFASKTETQGLVTVEAMLCKTPVVAIGEMGTKDVMNGDNGGFMVNEDREIFSAKVKLLLTDAALYEKKSHEAYEYAQNWTIEKTTLKMLDVYNSIIKR